MSKFLGKCPPSKLATAFKAAVGNVKHNTNKMDIARASVFTSLTSLIGANAAPLMDIDYILGGKIGFVVGAGAAVAIGGIKLAKETVKEVKKLKNPAPSV